MFSRVAAIERAFITASTIAMALVALTIALGLPSGVYALYFATVLLVLGFTPALRGRFPQPVSPLRKRSECPPNHKHLSPDILLRDIRNSILDGSIVTNRRRGQCYVLQDVTYVACPGGFLEDVLAQVPCVRKNSRGGVRRAIHLGRGKGGRPFYVVAFDTPGLFPDPRDLARVGYWPGRRIRERQEKDLGARKSISREVLSKEA